MERLEKAYEPSMYEDAMYKRWEESGFFNPDFLPEPRVDSFSIVLPPPNVTGTLHLGHAAMLALEDVMVRFARMRGARTLWIPGTDHAAIATQTKVEKMLCEGGMADPKGQLGREQFLKEVEKYAAASRERIVAQFKKMGASLDWSREAYTLDPQRSAAVAEAFSRLYKDGLIYKGDRVVNWCVRCASTLADDEVEHIQTNGTLYTFFYDESFPIPISTTRPETKFGDTAVAVHPDDARYASYVGKTFDVHFAGNNLSILVIADASVDPSLGTGALGVTPAHSNTDAQLAKDHGLSSRQVIDENACMIHSPLVNGMSVKEARACALDWLTQRNLLKNTEHIQQNLSVCYRCQSPIEPLPKLQWFIDVTKPFSFRASHRAPIVGIADGQMISLKELMTHVVRTRQVRIIPQRFEKTYFHWIDHLRDWNISRQIWFGHRVPVWYGHGEPVIASMCPGEGWIQDEDTLDTWFSAGLWTFSTLGWPKETTDLKRFHPTSMLETGYDILFFWVARMILMSTYLLGEVPFDTVYLHGLVRDESGRKMSKSLGNGIDPLDMISIYGADATRLSLIIGSTPGNDMKLSTEKISGYKHFTNKLWNIARYVLERDSSGVRPENSSIADAWIVGKYALLVREVTAHLESHEFSQAGEKLRAFTWNDFADWYVEASKCSAVDGDVPVRILEGLLVMWHPFMPFVTEAIWSRMEKESVLMIAPWPHADALSNHDPQRSHQFEQVMALVGAVRQFRATYQVPWNTHLSCVHVDGVNMSQEQQQLFLTLGRVQRMAPFEGKRVSFALGNVTLMISVQEIDVAAECARLACLMKEKNLALDRLEQKLANESFVGNAPADVVAKTHALRDCVLAELTQLTASYEQLTKH